MNLIYQIFPYVVAYTMPMLVTSLGGLYSERSGVTNLGLEGLMLSGYFGSAFAIKFLEGAGIGQNACIAMGLAAGAAAGIALALLHAFASITLKADQTISGTAINMLAAAVTVYVARQITGSGNISILMGIVPIDVPALSKIPVVGRMIFARAYWSTLLVMAIWGFSLWLLRFTSFGLRLCACGEHPSAVESAGVNVRAMRYFAVLASGALSGLGGAVMLVTYSGEFNGSVAGLGFLSIAALIFGQWKPLGILGATLFFGFFTTLANVSQVIPALGAVPPVIFKVFPYVVTLAALVFSSKKMSAPAANGQPY